LLPNLLQRVITYGMYFPLEQMWTSVLLQQTARTFLPDAPVLLVAPLAGQLTGATSGLVTNYLSLVKYRQYQRDIQKPLLHDVRRIFYKDLATLTRGLGATVARDSVFGSVFTSLRVLFQDENNQYAVNFCAASLATICSGPLNYARNLQYAYRASSTPGSSTSNKSNTNTAYPTIRAVLRELSQDARKGNFGQLGAKLRIGWGSLRVGIGMATGNFFYRYFENLLRGS